MLSVHPQRRSCFVGINPPPSTNVKTSITRHTPCFRLNRFQEDSVHSKESCFNWRLQCSSEDSPAILTLPIFPISVVALPSCSTPLHIFEARYRVLFNTLLAGASGLEEELIQDDSPYKGTRKFGICFVNSEGMVRVGTRLEIQSHMRLEDGRMMITSKGQDRFKIVRILRERPIMICEIEPYLDNEEISESELKDLSEEICELYRNIVKLSRKVKGNEKEIEDVKYEEPEEFNELTPSGLSFWFASLFLESPFEQQKLLEEQSSIQRLQREKKLFEDALKYLTAASALQGALNPDDKTDDNN